MKGSYSGIAFHLRGHCPTAEPARRPPDTADQHAPTSRRSTRERERITRAPALNVTPLTRFTVGHRASGNAAGRASELRHFAARATASYREPDDRRGGPSAAYASVMGRSREARWDPYPPASR